MKEKVGHRCLLLADGLEVFRREDGREIQLLDNLIFPFGMGTIWTIVKDTYTDYDWDIDTDEETETKYVYYTFILFDYSGKGFKFELGEKDIKAFGEYLLGCCEYMLAHGCPI